MKKTKKPFVGWALTHLHTPGEYWALSCVRELSINEIFEGYSFKTWKEAQASGHRCVRVKITEIGRGNDQQ